MRAGRGGLHRPKTASCHTRQCATNLALTPCIFEHVYLARPDSIIDGVSVYKARLRMGEKLAEKILRERPDHDIDVVIPIPDTSRTAALELANAPGREVPRRLREEPLHRPHLHHAGAGRSAKIGAPETQRDRAGVPGKNVMLVDDSIVRGTTCKQIIQMAREAGAKNVYFCVRGPAGALSRTSTASTCRARAGTDRPRPFDRGRCADLIGADWLIYQDLPDLIEAVGERQDQDRQVRLRGVRRPVRHRRHR